MANSWTTNDNIWHDLSAKSRGFYYEWSRYIMNGRDMLRMVKIYYERSRLYLRQDFHDRLRISWQVELLFWTVKMFTICIIASAKLRFVSGAPQHPALMGYY